MGDTMFDSRFADEVQEFGAVIRSALSSAGGVDLVRRAESDPGLRTREIEPLLNALGVLELVPAQDEDQLQAAAVACRAAGHHALPYPLAARLAGNTLAAGPVAVAVAVVDGHVDGHVDPDGHHRVDHADLPFDWRAVDLRGGGTTALRVVSTPRRKLGPFLAVVTRTDPAPAADPALPVALLLSSFTLLGLLDSALELTGTHVNDREQFGGPIVNYQAVQHQLADALIARELFEQQARYALWSLWRGRDGVLTDVVAARLAGLRAADKVLRTAHQLHGATGLADESTVSWLSRHSQPLRRLPLDPARTGTWFTELVLAGGLDGLFSDPASGVGHRGDAGPATNGRGDDHAPHLGAELDGFRPLPTASPVP